MEVSKLKKLAVLVLVVFGVGAVFAITPPYSSNFRDFFNLTGVNYVESNFFCFGGSCIDAWADVNMTFIDTNASTECDGTTTYLDGDGNCDDVSGVYVDVAGDSMGGDLDFDNNDLLDVANFTLSNDEAHHNIYDNSSCVIITGDTSVLEVC